MFDFYAFKKAVLVFVLMVLILGSYIYLNIIFIAPNIQLEPNIIIILGLLFLCFYFPIQVYKDNSNSSLKGVI